MRKVATPLIFTEQATPATPSSGFSAIYAKTDGNFYRKSDSGQELQMSRVFIDDDTFATATATNYASSESTKAYVDNEIVALDELAAGVRTTLDTGTPGFVGVDVVLSGGIAGGDTLTGGTAASETLTLASTAHATRGLINIRDVVNLISEDKTHTSTTVPFKMLDVPTTRTITLNDTGGGFNLGNSITVLYFGPKVLYDATSNVYGAGSVFHNDATIINRNAETRTITGILSFANTVDYTADGATVTFTGDSAALYDSPVYGVLNSGVATVTGTQNTVLSVSTIGTGATLTQRNGFTFTDATGAGTLTTQIGIDVPALAKGTTNIGIRNASTTVNPPPTATNITAVSATIPHNASTIQLTANASYTLTSAPTITDGQSGETLTIINVDTTDVITIQDQGTLASSNLRLSATTIALGPRDSIVLRYNATIGDWVQIGQTNVL